MSQSHHHLANLFYQNSKNYSDRIALQTQLNNKSYTWQEVWQSILKMIALLHEAGFQSKMKVSLWSSNCPEWVFSDAAILASEGVTVPIYTTLSSEEIRYILKDSNTRILILENEDYLSKIDPLLHECDQLWGIILLRGKGQIQNEKAHQKLFFWEEGDLNGADENLVVEKIQTLKPDELATIIYTSGTTGPPKGVMLTHENFFANISSVAEALPLTGDDVHLSFLPLSHVFERSCGYYLMIYKAATIAYAKSIDNVLEDALYFKPTFLMSVPRFYEKVLFGLKEKLSKASNLNRKIFNWAKNIGEKSLNNKSSLIKIQKLIASKLVYQKIKKVFGGRVRFCVSGGAPLDPEIGRFFSNLDLVIIEGYGLTETSPVIALNRIDRYRFGTVGIPLDSVEVKISEHGEIMTKSNSVMVGYYHNSKATDDVLKNGWFHTGDTGEIDEDGFLKITGRIKELICLSGGKKLGPSVVESKFQNQPSIERCFLYGEGKNFLTALIYPDINHLKDVAKGNKVEGSGWLKEAWVKEVIQKDIDLVHKQLAPFEQIKYFEVLERDFCLEEGELTPTLKVRRPIISSKYSHLLEPHYEKSVEGCK